jgi:hypothetical protein
MDIVVEKRKTATQPIFWLVMLMAYLDPYLFHSVIYIYIYILRQAYGLGIDAYLVFASQ